MVMNRFATFLRAAAFIVLVAFVTGFALFVREAVAMCPVHGLEAVELDPDRAAHRTVERLDGQQALITYPVRVQEREGYLDLRETLVRDGFLRLWHGGQVKHIDKLRPSDAVRSQLEVVVDRVRVVVGPE